MLAGPTNLQQGIAAPTPLPVPPAGLFGSLELPRGPESDGPPDGLTLDAAIESTVRGNLNLRTQSIEIPMARADVLTANLRANPVFYADSQLIPYGAWSRPAARRADAVRYQRLISV